jgi:TIR domain
MAKTFICYSRKDTEFAERLVADLRSRGVSLFFDQQDIQPGDEWDTTVENALDSSPWLLVILSPDSVDSQNVMDEVGQALSLKKRVIPIMYRPCKVRYRLARLQRVDFTQSYERAIQQLIAVMEAPPSSSPMPFAALQASPEIAARFGDLLRQRPAFVALTAVGLVAAIGAGIWFMRAPRPAPSPSAIVRTFDPSKPPSWCTEDDLNPAERAVCGNAELWALDAELNRKYYAAAERVGGLPEKMASLQKTENLWVHGQRNTCNADVQCLLASYHSRIPVLDGFK